MKVSIYTFQLVIGLTSIVTSGCSGNPVAEVTGTVTYRDRPLALAKIVFINDQGRSVVGTIENGSFTVRGVPAGDEVKVLVTIEDYVLEIERFTSLERRRRGVPEPQEGEQPMPLDKLLSLEVLDGKGQTDPSRQKEILELQKILIDIPLHYQLEEETPLLFYIKPGSQEISITLLDKVSDPKEEEKEPEDGANK